MGPWGFCKHCHSCGEADDWVNLAFNNIPLDNFYSRMHAMFDKYVDQIKAAQPKDKKLLLKWDYGHEGGMYTRYPFIGLCHNALEFFNDLAIASRKATLKLYKPLKGTPRIKDEETILVMPIYAGYGMIRGFTIYNGYITMHYYFGSRDRLYYRQGKNLKVDKVIVVNSLPEMMDLQSRTMSLPLRRPMDLILPFEVNPRYNFTPFGVVQPRKMYFLTRGEEWGLDFARDCDKRTSVRFLNADVPIAPHILNEHPDLFVPYYKYLKILKRYDELPPLKVPERDCLYTVDETGIYKIVKDTKIRMSSIPICVMPTDLKHQFKVKIYKNSRVSNSTVHEMIFKTRNSFNRWLNNKIKPPKKAEFLLEGWGRGSILLQFLELQPILEDHFNDEKEKQKEKEFKRKSA